MFTFLMFALEKNWLIAKSVWEKVFEIPSTKCDLTFSHTIRHASVYFFQNPALQRHSCSIETVKL